MLVQQIEFLQTSHIHLVVYLIYYHWVGRIVINARIDIEGFHPTAMHLTYVYVNLSALCCM